VESNRVGALSIADVYRQQSQVASDELSLIQAQNTYETSKTNLVALIGLDPTVDYDFEDASIRTEIDSTEIAATRERYSDIAALITRALQARPDYLAARQELSAAEDGVTVARSGYWPSIGAFASYGQGNENFSGLSDNKTLNWGIGVNWSLFDQFRTNEALQGAQVSRRNAELSLAQAERDIGVEVKKALLDLDAAAKSVEVSRKAQVSAQEDYKIAEERYNLGAGTLLDRLVANASLVNAQATRVNAIAGYLITKFNLEYAIGERTY
jgi:outer membrane protein